MNLLLGMVNYIVIASLVGVTDQTSKEKILDQLKMIK